MAKETKAHPVDGRPLRLMAKADGYVMARRPGCIPFVMAEKEWNKLDAWLRSASAHEQDLRKRASTT